MTTLQDRLRAAAMSPDAFDLPDLMREAADALDERERQIDYHKGLEEAALQTRGEIEWLGVKYDKAVEALRACVAELVYVHECEVWINRGEERFAAIEAAREALK